MCGVCLLMRSSGRLKAYLNPQRYYNVDLDIPTRHGDDEWNQGQESVLFDKRKIFFVVSPSREPYHGLDLVD
jgi:hypothetical protein